NAERKLYDCSRIGRADQLAGGWVRHDSAAFGTAAGYRDRGGGRNSQRVRKVVAETGGLPCAWKWLLDVEINNRWTASARGQRAAGTGNQRDGRDVEF